LILLLARQNNIFNGLWREFISISRRYFARIEIFGKIPKKVKIILDKDDFLWYKTGMRLIRVDLLRIKTMSDLTIGEIMSMTDEELVKDLVDSGDISVCEKCKVPLQESITGYRTIIDDQGNKCPYCSDCYFSYDPLLEAVNAYIANPANRNPVPESELFVGCF
jgi:hypothetical protein